MNESSIMDTRPASIRKSSALQSNSRVPWLSRAGTLRNAPGPLRLHLQSYWWPRWSWAAARSHLWTSSWRVSCVPHYLSGSITRHPLTRTHSATFSAVSIRVCTGVGTWLNCDSQPSRKSHANDKCPEGTRGSSCTVLRGLISLIAFQDRILGTFWWWMFLRVTFA